MLTPSDAVVPTQKAVDTRANTAQSEAESYADTKFFPKGNYTLGNIPVTGNDNLLHTIDGILAGTNISISTDPTTGAKTISSTDTGITGTYESNIGLIDQNLGNDTTGTVGDLSKQFATYNGMAAKVTAASNPNKFVAKYASGLHAETTIALKPYVNMVGESIDASIITATNPITLDSAFALADDDNSVILQNVFIGSQMNLNLKTVGGTSSSTIAFLTTVVADEINYTVRTINDTLLLLQSFLPKMTITDGVIDIQSCNTIGSSMTFIADTAGLNAHINSSVLPNISIMGGSATVSNAVSIKNCRLDGTITLHGTYAQLSIDANSMPVGGIFYADGATSAQVTYLTKTYNVAGSPIQLANLSALQNYADLGQMTVGMLGTALDTGLVYTLTTKSTPGSHIWTPIESGTGNISGTLTATKIPVATGANTIADSKVTQDITQDSGQKTVLKVETPTDGTIFAQIGISKLWNLAQLYATKPWEIWANSLKVCTFDSVLSNSQLMSTDANGKVVSQAKGNLAESTSSVLTITGGSGSVVGSGTTIEVKQASDSQSGYLSSTDWSTFNSKQNLLWLKDIVSGSLFPDNPPINIQNGRSVFLGDDDNNDGYNFTAIGYNSNGNFDDNNLSYSKLDNGRLRFNNVIGTADYEICRLDPLGNDIYFQDNSTNETYRFDRLLGNLTISGDFFSANYTQDISDAANGANSPMSSNVFATMADLSGVTVPAPKLETSDVNSSYYYSGLQITADDQTALSVSQAPLAQASTFLFLNGQFAPPGPTTDNTHWYTLSGSTITWNNSNVDGVKLKTTDTIIVMYNYINGFDGYKTDTVPVTWAAPTAGSPTSSLVFTKVGNDITMDIKALTSGYISGNATNGVITAANIVPALYRPTTMIWDSINVFNSNSGAGQISSWGLVQIATDGTVTIGWGSTGEDFQTITSGSFGFHSKAIPWTK
jgi:hypothetical protein